MKFGKLFHVRQFMIIGVRATIALPSSFSSFFFKEILQKQTQILFISIGDLFMI